MVCRSNAGKYKVCKNHCVSNRFNANTKPLTVTSYNNLSLYLKHIKCDQIYEKGSYTRTASRHTFHCHLLTTSMHQQHMCLILLKVEQSAFTRPFSQAYLASTSARVAFKYPHLPLTSRQPTVNHHTVTRLVDEFDHGFSCFMWHVEVKMAPMEVIFLFLVKT